MKGGEMKIKEKEFEALAKKIQDIRDDKHIMELLRIMLRLYPVFERRRFQEIETGRSFEVGDRICYIMEDLFKYGFNNKTRKQRRAMAKAITLIGELLGNALDIHI